MINFIGCKMLAILDLVGLLICGVMINYGV